MKPFLFGISANVDGSAWLPTTKVFDRVGRNVGNLAFHYAIARILGLGDDGLAWRAPAAAVSAAGTVGVMPCANQLGPHIDFGGLARLFQKLEVNLVAIGLGAQGATSYDSVPIVPEGTLNWVREIQARSFSDAPNIGVRGPFSLKVLAHYGLASKAIVTGCPTLFLNPDPELGRLVAENLKKRPDRIAVAAGNPKWKHLGRIESSLTRMLSAGAGAYIVQGPIEMLHLARNEAGLLSDEALEESRAYACPDLTIAQFKDWSRAHARAFFNVSEWMEHLRGYDYVVGPRIHGVILGIQAGVPSLCIAHDSRTRELCETLKVPFVMAGELRGAISRDDLPRLIRFDADEFDENRRRMADVLNGFLEGNGLGSSAWLSRIAGHQAAAAVPARSILESTTSSVSSLAKSGNHSAIADAWSRFREHCPEKLLGYTEGAAALRAAGRAAQAEALALQAVERFPDEPVPAFDHARAAFDRRDLPLAIARWEAARQRFPDHPASHLGLAQSLRVAQRYEDAERVAHDAMLRTPGNAALAVEYARGAFNRGDFEAAIGRWEDVRNRFPALHDGFTCGVQCLRLAGRLIEADALAEAALKQFPNLVDAWSEYARIMEKKEAWLDASHRWQLVREKFPELLSGFLSGARALRLARKFGEAEQLLVDAQAKFPDSPPLIVEYVRCATDRRDPLEAARRTTLLRQRFPRAVDSVSLDAASL